MGEEECNRCGGVKKRYLDCPECGKHSMMCMDYCEFLYTDGRKLEKYEDGWCDGKYHAEHIETDFPICANCEAEDFHNIYPCPACGRAVVYCDKYGKFILEDGNGRRCSEARRQRREQQ
jgi:hypothetical protein